VTGPELFEVVLGQRACRSFTDEDVPDDDVMRMLEAAVHAPSAENAQPWMFVVVREAARRAAIADLTRRLWHGQARAFAEPRLDARLLDEVDRATAAGFGGAPVLVVAAGDTRGGTPRRALASSVLPAVQNLLLAATALGYGSVLTTLATAAADELRAMLDLPDGVEPLAVVPVGRPARSLGPPRRLPVAAKAHRERYGVPFGATMAP
jgi:nitroreductase